MATASGDRARWLRRVVPLWLVLPLYAAAVAWVGALVAASKGLDDFLFEVVTESGQQVEAPQLTGNPLTNVGLVLLMRIGNVEWSTVPLVALVMAASVVAVHRAAGPSERWPRVAALGGLVVGAVYTLAVLSPLLATKLAEPVLAAFGVLRHSDDYSPYTWGGHALICLILVAVFANLAFQPGPAVASEPEDASDSLPDSETTPEAAGAVGSETTSDLRHEPAPPSGSSFPEPVRAVVIEPDPLAASEMPGSFDGNGHGPRAPDPHAAYRRPFVDRAP